MISKHSASKLDAIVSIDELDVVGRGVQSNMEKEF
jgi:hypothetical protein